MTTRYADQIDRASVQGEVIRASLERLRATARSIDPALEMEVADLTSNMDAFMRRLEATAPGEPAAPGARNTASEPTDAR
ncbi:MAG TPA: hypothetical protein VEZ14_03255 [Dehalococcoidia bacterium]|nr:hypothetical protein [Dehalococcoidia bacterium]